MMFCDVKLMSLRCLGAACSACCAAAEPVAFGAEEIRELLVDFPVLSVQLQCGSGTGAGVARASLEDPEMLEEWDRDRLFLLRGQRVPVAPTPTDMLLCVARLPLHYTESQFTGLVRSYGEVRRCFLMISEKTGESKGYGFVEYMSKETALHAKNMLDRKSVEDLVLCCDWLDSSHVTFESLHSKCLFVDHLPKDFRDMGQFRKVFSAIVSPPYCQIALKNGCPQDWGLVEYSSAEDAEAAQSSLNRYLLCGQPIRVSYYMPGVRAINLYLKLLNESSNKKSCGLLPDPTAPAVFQQLQTLAKQNPVFAQNLQNIIMTQIQSLQSEGKQRSPTPPGGPAANQPNANKGKPVATPPNGLIDSQMQQLKNQLTSTHPMLMANPQMLASLQSLLKQQQAQNPGGPGAQGPQGAPQGAQGPQGPGAGVNGQGPGQGQGPKGAESQHNGFGKHGKNGFLKPSQPAKVSVAASSWGRVVADRGAVAVVWGWGSWEPSARVLLMDRAPCRQVPLLPNPGGHGHGHGLSSPPLPGQVQPAASVPVSVALSPTPSDVSAWGGVGVGVGMMGLAPPRPHPHPRHHTSSPPSGAQAGGLPLLMPGLDAFPPPSDPLQMGAGPGDLQTTINSILNNQQNLRQLMATLSSAIQSNGSHPAGAPQVPPPGSHFPFVGRPPPGAGPGADAWAGAASRSLMSSPIQMQPKPMGFLDMKAPNPGAQVPLFAQVPGAGQWPGGGFMPSPVGVGPMFSPYSGGLVPGLWSPSPSPSPTLNGMMTPVGHKRKYNHILPSPEPSPEGNYIGQHSQGLGGHYADSYFKRKKKN
ncbi:Ribonucleoprotein PTB-binding 1 [Frankliniella fusca]|uniref:Ribonucleoprotein PTB-binding 1 n=1 Tax=Frankliniella fusca TaxID=407009 RepID=A0AAE1GV09_9NEOP|nr:Ribonucleoprotein PTB-binding 1 [Frankliniella fusca]